MQEDKTLKELLNENAMQETSSSFNEHVMQCIQVAGLRKSTPLISSFVLNFLLFFFFVVLVTVIICLMVVPLNGWPLNITFDISAGTYDQLLSFILIFWLMMFINMLWNKWQSMQSG
jgi:hypothetical protein